MKYFFTLFLGIILGAIACGTCWKHAVTSRNAFSIQDTNWHCNEFIK